MQTIYRAAKYKRTSCPDNEAEYRDSIAHQSSLMDDFLIHHPEIQVIMEQSDDGYSGLFFERPGLKEILTAIKAGKINCLIMKDISRLGRDYIEVGRYLRSFFPEHKVRLISVDDQIDSVDPDGFDKVIALMKSIFSEQYSHDISVKTRSALDAKRKQGKYVGAVPMYGYQKSSFDKHRLEPDPNTAPVVREIYEMKLRGMSAASIATTLNSQGALPPLAYKRRQEISCPAGGFSESNHPKWSATTVLRILKDETYTGTLVQGRQRKLYFKSKVSHLLPAKEWIKAEKTHQPIVSKAYYNAVQRALVLDSRTGHGQDGVYPLSGLLICGCCGESMTRKTVKSNVKSYHYYYCPTPRSRCLFIGMIPEKQLENLVLQGIQKHIEDTDALFSRFSNQQTNEAFRRELTLELADIQEKIHRSLSFQLSLQDSMAAKVIDEAEYRALLNFYEAELCRLHHESKSIQQKLIFNSCSMSFDNAWKDSFLSNTNLSALDRKMVLLMVEQLHLLSKAEIEIRFTYQAEMEQATSYLEQKGECDYGAKKQKTK